MNPHEKEMRYIKRMQRKLTADEFTWFCISYIQKILQEEEKG